MTDSKVADSYRQIGKAANDAGRAIYRTMIATGRAFAEAVSPLCYCSGRPAGHAWNPTPGFCPNPQQAER
jgi:hypothetical protein